MTFIKLGTFFLNLVYPYRILACSRCTRIVTFRVDPYFILFWMLLQKSGLSGLQTAALTMLISQQVGESKIAVSGYQFIQENMAIW